MPDSWHLDPPLAHSQHSTQHAHKLSGSDPWKADAPHRMGGPSSASGEIPTHYQPGAGAQLASADLPGEALGASMSRHGSGSGSGTNSGGGKKGKEREREVLDLVKYDVPVWLAVMGDMIDTSKGRDKVLVRLLRL
jgi:hypothetical protein